MAFEDLYGRMLSADAFAPILPTYYERWLHSDQEVTLEDRGGLAARIVGISEYGLLRCEALSGARDVYELQPDGNSFDLMKSLVSTKK